LVPAVRVLFVPLTRRLPPPRVPTAWGGGTVWRP
jgi:hypothetical protein